MKSAIPTIIKFAPLTVGLLILGIGALFVPWEKTLPYLGKISPFTYALLLVIGISYYVVRALRYAYMLRELGEKKSLKDVLTAYFEAQPLSLIPGGEAYRTVTLKRHANIPFVKSIPVVFLQSFTENIGLVILALFSSFFIHTYALLVAVILAVYIAILVLIRTRRTAKHGHKIINRIPFVNVTLHKIRSFVGHNRTLLSGKSFVILIATSFISTLLAISAVYLTAKSFDVELNFPQATLAFTIPMVIQNTTFLPGGIGVNEQSSVGLLLLLGLSAPSAVALTIVVRGVTQALGIVLGLIMVAIGKVNRT